MTKKTIKAQTYKGMPSPEVELTEEELNEARGAEQGSISVSLESLNSDLQNQSYGLIVGSTGCISNPGGPSC